MYRYLEEDYYIFIFDQIVKSINESIDSPEKYWFKASYASEPVCYNRILQMNDDQKKEFVKNIVLIHGIIDSTSLKGIQYKKTGWRCDFRSLLLNLSFDSEEDKLQYFMFHKHTVGLLAEEV